ncbi:glycosyltransferase family 2 protein [Confluentibacter citreus]|uniref:glycosyltransferase family 2 protein n=1 Tax=Confluentibacter citreus TaxID=2007307 RepID=UPI000C282022|nr:glycosyltransferase family 2 protein [Confluentibacter citreus]
MISICIPIYNFDVVNLVEKLNSLSKSLEVPSEIILIDDCSDIFFKEKNENVGKKHTYIKLEKNIGRAAIRNRFLKYAKYEYLLFLDCDSIVHKNIFLVEYVEAIKSTPNTVLCGGRVYENQPPQLNKRLRWKYGKVRESKISDERNLNPHKSFMTHNFVVSRKIFETISFDERLTSYGHEDTLFGFQLKKGNIKVRHIENPILNGELETNSEYISSTETAIGNLVEILGFLDCDKGFIKDVSLLNMYFRVAKFKTIIEVGFKVFQPLLKKMLSLGFVNLYLFDFYKLGILILKMKDRDIKRIYN